MNIEQAKSIPVDDLLQYLAYDVAKVSGGRKWYRSPFRNERTASFVLSKDGMAWFDHGEGVGGNIIDLAMRMGDCRDVKQALSYLDDVSGHMGYTIPTTHQRLPVKPTEPAYTLQSMRTMADRRGENWCRSRELDIDACRPFLSDVYFTRAGKPDAKPMYGVGLPNIAGGAEMRTQFNGGAWVKSSVGHKAISVFLSERDDAGWYLFEGLPDFCTFLTHRRPAVDDLNFLILNGTGMTAQAIDLLKHAPPAYLTLCPQHGSQGSLLSCEALRDFVAEQHGWGCGDIDYPKDAEDYNAWHMKVKGRTPVAAKPIVGTGLHSTLKFNL